MNRISKLRKYAELFRRQLRGYLSEKIRVGTTIYPVNEEGAVFEFFLGSDIEEKEEVRKPFPKVNDVLTAIPQRMVGGNLSNVRFGGTNLYLEKNRILVIKGEDEAGGWGPSQIEEDVKRVVSMAIGSEPDGQR